MRLAVPLLAALVLSTAPASAAVFTINTEADKNDQSTADNLCRASDGTCSLRAAIQQANALMGADQIDVPAGTYKLTIASDLAITSNLTINGPAGARSTVIDFNTLANSLTMNASGVFINGLAVTGARGSAAAVLVGGGEATLTGLDVHDNKTTGGFGGGIAVSNGQVSILDSAITDNTTTGSSQAIGGGVFVQTGATVSIVATTIAGNTAQATGVGSNSFGGGISSAATSLALRHVTLLNNTSTSGSASQQGGNLYVNSPTTLSDSILAGGSAFSGPQCYTPSAANLTVTGKNIYAGGGSNDCTFPAGTVVSTTPQTTALENHGGPGQTAVPLAGSPAIDAAAACPDGGKDQRGAPAPTGAACDIGAAEAGADLQVSLTASSTSVDPGDAVAFVAKVVNAGLDASTSTMLTVTPPSGAQILLVAPSTGSCTDPAVCSLGTLAPGQSSSVTVVVRAPATGPLQTTATASGGLPDPTPADASAAVTTFVNVVTTPPPPSDTTAPVITKLGALGRLVAGRLGRLRVTASEEATVIVLVQRLIRGHRLGLGCSVKVKRGKRCDIPQELGRLRKKGGPGRIVIYLPRLIEGHKVTPGRYRLFAAAVDASGNLSRAIRTTVKVLPRRRAG